MFQTLIAAMLAYYRAHPDQAAIQEVLGNFATFAQSVHFWSWANRTAPWNKPQCFQELEHLWTQLYTEPDTFEPQFEAAMARAFTLLF
jgi:hypothetical protein